MKTLLAIFAVASLVSPAGGSVASTYDRIRVTVWPGAETRDSGGYRQVVIQTQCDNAHVVKYLEYKPPNGGFERYTVAGTVYGAVEVGNSGARIPILAGPGVLTDWGYDDRDIVYTIETLDVFGTGHGKNIVVSDSSQGVSEPDPECLLPITVPTENKTSGAVKALYE